MAENQFVAKLIAHILHVEVAGFTRYLGIECYMKQYIAQFLADVLLVVLHQGITQFIRLFYGIRPQALVGLLTVPRTFLTEFIQYIQEASECFHLFFSGMHIEYYFSKNKGNIFSLKAK